MNPPSLKSDPEITGLPLATGDPKPRRGAFAAIFTDSHFWIPVIVLAAGTALLFSLS
jgi:hypothetical protein